MKSCCANGDEIPPKNKWIGRVFWIALILTVLVGAAYERFSVNP